MPIAQTHLEKYMSDIGYEVSSMVHLKCKSPVLIACTPQNQIRSGLLKLIDDGATAIIQFGANLPMAHFAGIAEKWLSIPVISVNVATYWYALRSNQINDKITGFGELMEKH